MVLRVAKDSDALAGKVEKIGLLAAHYGLGVVSLKDGLYDKVRN